MTILVLKIILVPLLISTSILCGRLFGSFVGGVVAGLPIISGPISFFLALEQGPCFAAQACLGTYLGVLSCSATALSYPWAAVLGCPWFVALPVSLLTFFAFAWLTLFLPKSFFLIFCLAAFAPLVIKILLPRHAEITLPTHTHNPLLKVWQMLLGIFMVVSVTALADRFGSDWSGILMFFPVMIVSIVPFIHATLGAAAVVQSIRGFMTGWFGGIGFMLVVYLTVLHTSIALCFTLATLTSCILTGSIAYLELHNRKKSCRTHNDS